MSEIRRETIKNMNQKGYQKLNVYNEANKLVLDVYRITVRFPKSELFGLISQMRRCAISVVANIIEGQARNTKKEFRQFLYIANGSLAELEYYLELSLALEYIPLKEYNDLEQQRIVAGSLLGGLIKSIKLS